MENVFLKNRIKTVFNYKKPAFWVMIAVVALIVAVIVCFFVKHAGMKITDIKDSGTYTELFDNIEGITVASGDKRFIITQEDKIDEMVGVLKEIRISREPVSQSREESRDMTNRITFNGNTLCFNKDFTELWILDSVKPSFSYKVMVPETANLLFLMRDSKQTTPVTGEFSSGSDVYGLTVNIKDIVLDAETPYIEVEYVNENDKEFLYGESFDIGYKKSGIYQSCMTRILYFNSIGNFLMPNGTADKKYILTDFDLSKDGSYRFETDVIYKPNEDTELKKYKVWIDFELKNQTEDEMRENKNDSATMNTQIKDLKEKYPQYFDLSTVNGLEVYVVPLILNPVFPTTLDCYLFSGTGHGYEYKDLDSATSVSADEMRLILSTYQDISSSEINVVAFNNPLTRYYIEITNEYINELRSKLGVYNAKLDAYPSFKATVVETYENGSVLVEAFEDESIRNVSAQFVINIDGVYENNDRPIKTGDKIRIVYNGKISETSPAQIADIRAVVLIDGGVY